MILDASFLLSGAIAASGALAGQPCVGTDITILSTNTVDLGLPTPGDSGAGARLHVGFTVLTAPTGGTSVQFQLIQADDAGLASNVQVLKQTAASPIASLPAGTLVTLSLSGQPFTPKRYVGARYVLTGAVASMTVFAAMAEDLQATRIYKAAFVSA